MELPADFKSKYQKLMGDDADSFFKSLDQETNPGYRVNPLKEYVVPENDKDSIDYCQYGYYGDVNGKSVEHQSGAIYSQEPSAMYVGEVADITPGDYVLDLCASPGGKTTHVASYMQNQGLLVTNEIDYKRAKVLVENVERFGIRNALILNENPNNLAKHFPRFFDKILIDAPCSGEGMFRKNNDAINYWNADYPVECAIRQKEIIEQAVKMLKPGGKIIYSTCTFAPEEDEQIVEWMHDEFDFTIDPIQKYEGMVDGKPDWANGNPDLTNTVRLFPNHFKGEGHFISKLSSNENGSAKKIKNRLQGNLTQDDKKLWDEFKESNLINFDPKHLILFGDQLYTFDNTLPDLKGLKVMRPGLHLGTIKKKRFEPSYALALALHSDEVVNRLEITEDDWKQYVHGDTISCDAGLSKGWYQLICKNQPIAFGKVVNGTVKNFFPKGLRFNI
ncbi:MAG: RsmF rRNA methyltransferase first C-terminal domain-containing protein [Apilactobacillus sp.]|uniref:RsmF rRNA methyltransferase first C-terminal domain-containing protein n=1 Tax=Apilactobacillus sp. TaxID=2767901 RepID=UPI0025E62EE5|nr:RsmB/NOP family class I SAM-dependent RNA methyltransferase [Apilactobacillus sp.]MCT6822329.1 RsmF rRNA methyltransferase first C-terminal domain-containing protein [Apilactobacillus sp.]MCT6857671.1 RsmF rRNA methyltransferase first C-terminal domain-containing protein [Apilactobacillus sp.]